MVRPVKAPTTGAGQIVAALSRRGVSTIFTLSGNQVLPLFDVLLDAGIRLLSTRHEAGDARWLPPGGGGSGVEAPNNPTSEFDRLDELMAAVGAAREPLLLGSPSVARSPEFRAAAAHLGCPSFALESARAGSDPI